MLFFTGERGDHSRASGGGDEAKEAFARGDKEEMPEMIPGVGEGFEVQPEVEDIDEKPHITLAKMKVGPSLGISHVAPT